MPRRIGCFRCSYEEWCGGCELDEMLYWFHFMQPVTK